MQRGLTDMERQFVDSYVRTGDAAYAADKAGYANAPVAAPKLVIRPRVQAEIRAELRRMVRDAAYDAIKHLHTCVNDDKARNADRNKAADTLLKYAFGDAPAEAGDKAPHEMTGPELARAIAVLEARAARVSAIDVTVSGAGDDGILG